VAKGERLTTVKLVYFKEMKTTAEEPRPNVAVYCMTSSTSDRG